MIRQLLIIHLFLFSAQFAIAADDAPNSAYKKTSTEAHDMRVVNSGIASLYARIDMIRRAEKTIELESFIFNPDTSGRLILQELAAAARRGVVVKILVDKSIAVFKLDEFYASALKEKGIEIRYYNSAPLYRISSAQYRNHRKMLVRDGEEAITGGRNIGDEYFDLSEVFNFHDRDVTVEGEVVKTMQGSFDRYWNSAIVQTPLPLKKPEYISRGEEGDEPYKRKLDEYNKKIKKAQKVFEENINDKKLLQFILDDGKLALEENQKRKCPEITFATDKEGAVSNDSKYRLLRQEIGKWMKENVKRELTIDSPYFLENDISQEMANNFLSSKIKVNIFTNSLASTDAVHVSTVFNDTVNKYTPNENFKAFTFKGKFSGENKLFSDKIKKAIWGTHSKSMVFNEDSFMVGTFNIDNRSSVYNTELSIMCKGSRELTADVLNNINKRMEGSYRLNSEGLPDDCSNLLGEVGEMKKFLYYILKVPSHFFQFLF